MYAYNYVFSLEVKEPTSEYNLDDYDSPWKIALDNYLEEFIDFYFPKISQLIDWSVEPKSLDNELQAVVKDSELGRNRADKLVEVTLKTGNKRLLNIHIEVQSQQDASFERRMFTYFYRIFDKYGEMLLSLAVLADTSPNWQPSSYRQQQITSEINFNFASVKLLNYESQLEELKNTNNAFALLTAAHLLTKRTKHQPEERKENKLTLVKLLYKNGWAKEKIVNFFAILDWLMQLPSTEALEFRQQLTELEEEQKMRYVTSIERMGIQKGLELGREEGLQEGIESNLRQNVINMQAMLNLTAEKIAEVVEVPLEKVKQILNQDKK